MPKSSIPRLCKRRSPSTGRVLGYAKVNGKTVSFGAFDEGAEKRYQEFVARWLARGSRPADDQEPEPYAVCDLVADFLEFAGPYYRHAADGKPTGTTQRFRDAARPLLSRFGVLQAREFDLAGLKVYREDLVARDLSRITVNDRVQLIQRMFSWAAEEEKIPPEVPVRLKALRPLQRGRSLARDLPPRQPVEWDRVEKTLQHVTATLRALLLTIWWTGMRIGDALGASA